MILTVIVFLCLSGIIGSLVVGLLKLQKEDLKSLLILLTFSVTICIIVSVVLFFFVKLF